MRPPVFRNRHDAGRQLATKLLLDEKQPETVVLGLPRGGIVIGYEIAEVLNVPLEPFVVRKLGAPEHEELAMGALASGGIVVLNDLVIERLKISRRQIDDAVNREALELKRREKLYRGGPFDPTLKKKRIIVVDDGLATGATMQAALTALKKFEPQKLIMAVPVASADICAKFSEITDETVCLVHPPFLESVGAWYEDFSQTTDEEVISLLSAHKRKDAPDKKPMVARRSFQE